MGCLLEPPAVGSFAPEFRRSRSCKVTGVRGLAPERRRRKKGRNGRVEDFGENNTKLGAMTDVYVWLALLTGVVIAVGNVFYGLPHIIIHTNQTQRGRVLFWAILWVPCKALTCAICCVVYLPWLLLLSMSGPDRAYSTTFENFIDRNSIGYQMIPTGSVYYVDAMTWGEKTWAQWWRERTEVRYFFEPRQVRRDEQKRREEEIHANRNHSGDED